MIRFQVAPYALFDVLKAFENQKTKYSYVDYGVTKEDDALIVFAREVIFAKAHSVPQTSEEVAE